MSEPRPGSFDFTARQQPDAIAVIDGGERRSWDEWDARACRLGDFLRERFGLQPGDRVAWMMHNRIEYYDLAFALQKIGCVGVSVGFRLTGPEAAYIIDNSDAKAVVCEDIFAAPLAGAMAEMPNISEDRFLVVDSREDWRDALPKATPFEDAIAAGRDERYVAEGEALGGSIIYTSGTTGRPKGAFRDGSDPDLPAALRTFMISVIQAFGYAPPERHLLVCPLYHSAPPAISMITHLMGGTVVIQRHFDAEETLRLIEKHQITSAFVVPIMLTRIAALPEEVRARYDLSSMKRLLVGAAPFPATLKRKTVPLFPNPCVYEFYGATETAFNTILGPEDMLRKADSCGKVIAGCDIKIVDDEGKEVPTGEIGVLYVKNPILISGYYKNKKATDECLLEGYFTVGDLARVDDEGFYYIVDRQKDMIISGGVNIYPAEIEIELRAHPDVFDCAVIGVPNEEWGEEVKAVVQLKPGASVEAEEIREFLIERLADYKRPRSVDFIDEMPYNPSGKLLKKELREKYWSKTGRSI